jgi:hypothetical protein
VLVWAKRVCAQRGAPPHELLELRANATVEQAQDAFYKVARVAHPDLHRNYLREDELEVVTTAYALVAGAYQAFRTQPIAAPTTNGPSRDRAASPTGSPPVTSSGPAPQPGGAQALSTRAQVYYRKAELALKSGNLKGAVLQLKLAIATEPGSGFLRTALGEVEAELKKA